MKTQERINEVGMVSAIISDHIMKRLYAEMQKRGTGYISTVEKISEWAQEFVKKHEKTNWEDVLMNNSLKPLSKEISEIICWDDAAIDWAYYKLAKFKKD